MLKAKNTLIVATVALILSHHGAQGRNAIARPAFTPAWGKPKGFYTTKRPLAVNKLETLPVYNVNIAPELSDSDKKSDNAVTSVPNNKEYQSAIRKTGLAVSAAALFGMGLMATRGRSTAYQFVAGYLVEQSLSVDNLFVFIMLFDYFKVPIELQSRVLSWGIAGAITLRGIMIAVGAAAIQKFQSVMLVIAGILLVSSFKLLTESEGKEDDVSDNAIMRFTSKFFRNMSTDFDGDKFFVTNTMGKRMATPLFLCLICVELSDFVFAADSILAVLGVCEEPLVVYASNIFAMLALRSVYTVVAKAVTELHYLKPAVAGVLGFVGTKMIAEYFHVQIGTATSLGVIVSLLGSGILASVWENSNSNRQFPSVWLPSWIYMIMTTYMG